MDPTVQVALVGGGLGLLTLAATELRAWRQTRQLSQIRHQVENTHETNLRDDVDRVLEGLDRIELTQSLHSKEISGLREEMRQERVERADLERRFDRHVDRDP